MYSRSKFSPQKSPIDANVVAVENLTDSLTKMMDVRNLSSDVFVSGNQRIF